MSKLVIQSLLIFLILSVVTGLIYPLLITAVAQGIFPYQANGSIIKNTQGQALGSALLGQQFSKDKYFFSRPSATSPYSYNAAGSCGSNLGPTNGDLLSQIKQRAEAFQNSSKKPVPVDLVTASGSGLDPDVSVEAADYQVERIARARNVEQRKVVNLVRQFMQERQWAVFGERRVNVLQLNLALDEMK